MKTGELIKMLQELDPSGETEVVAGGVPIYFAEALPAYYDGCLQMLVQDKSKEGYNITGFKVTDQGKKIKLHLVDVESVLWDDANAPVDLSEIRSAHSLKIWTDDVAKIRDEIKTFEKENENK